MRMVRVLVAEKSQETRQAIVDALGFVDTIAVQGAVPDLRAAVSAITRCAPDIIVTGVELADGDGIDLIQATLQVAPHSRIVVVGVASCHDVCRRHLAAGAHRFVERDATLRQLREVVAGLVAPPPAPLEDELHLLGRMAAGVAHDLNNYLAVIHATLALLEHAPRERDLFTGAFDGVAQAARLTSTLLSYVRGHEPVFERIELGPLVRRTLALIDRTLPPRVEIRVDIAHGLPPIRGVAAELEQLVLNLVLNAADAMPYGGDLTVRVLPTGGAAVYLEVSDSGTGLTVEPPATGDIATVSTKPGRRLGLGLGIVQRVVDRHAGALAIAPRRECPGTVAIIFLPAG
jgi:signal transduction histidine kinase